MTEQSSPNCKQAVLCLTVASMEALKLPVLATGWPAVACAQHSAFLCGNRGWGSREFSLQRVLILREWYISSCATAFGWL